MKKQDHIRLVWLVNSVSWGRPDPSHHTPEKQRRPHHHHGWLLDHASVLSYYIRVRHRHRSVGKEKRAVGVSEVKKSATGE